MEIMDDIDISDSNNSSIKNDSSFTYSSIEQLSSNHNRKSTNDSSRIGMTYYDPRTYIVYPCMLRYKSKPIQELTKLKTRYQKLINSLDIVVMLLDMISFSLNCLWLFKTVQNDYIPIPSSDAYLYSTLALSLLTIALIIIRMLVHIKEKRILHLMNIIFYYAETEYYYIMCIECVIHLIQPYPWLKNCIWKSIYNNYKLYHSLNCYLFLIMLIRLYTVGRLIKKCSTFNTERAKRMLSYYWITNEYNFIFKSKIRNNDALFFIVALAGFLFIGGFIINVLECFVENHKCHLSYMESVWDLALMILTICYSTKLTKNPVSNTLEAVLAYIGLFFLTILILNFISWLHLDQDEQKSDKIIEIIKYKSQKGFIKKYLDEYIKYKAVKMRRGFDFQEFCLKKQAFLIIRKNTLIRMKQTLNERYEIDDFVNGILLKRDKIMNVNNNQFINELRVLEKNLVDLKDKSDAMTKDSRKIKANSNRIYNLAKIMTDVGSFAIVKNINFIKGKDLVSSNDISVSLREFQVKYKDRNEKGNDLILNAKFNDCSTIDDNSLDLLSFYGSSDCE